MLAAGAIAASFYVPLWWKAHERPQISAEVAVAIVRGHTDVTRDSTSYRVTVDDVLQRCRVLAAGYAARNGTVAVVPDSAHAVVKLTLRNDGDAPAEDLQLALQIDPTGHVHSWKSPNIKLDQSVAEGPGGRRYVSVSVPSLAAHSTAMVSITSSYDSAAMTAPSYGSGPRVQVGSLTSKLTGNQEVQPAPMSAGAAFAQEATLFGTRGYQTYFPLRTLRPNTTVLHSVFEEERGKPSVRTCPSRT